MIAPTTPTTADTATTDAMRATEAALLGAMLLDQRGDAISAGRRLSANDFSSMKHAALFNAVIEHADSGAPMELPAFAQRLAERGILADIGGLDGLVGITDACALIASADHHARTIRAAADRRRLEAALDDARQRFTACTPTSDIVEHLRGAIELPSLRDGPREPQNAGAAALGVVEAIERGEAGPKWWTGFEPLDWLTLGLHPGELTVIGARPGQGKSTLALCAADNLARNGVPVAFFSLEMTAAQLSRKLLSRRARIHGNTIRDPRTLTAQNIAALRHHAEELRADPLTLAECPGLSVGELRSRCRTLTRAGRASVIVLDYLQLLRVPGSDGAFGEVSEASRTVKEIAGEFGAAVIALSQLNRASESREDRRPRMSELRQSGQIEQDADVVMLLHREEYYHPGDEAWAAAHPNEVGAADVAIAKNRNGETGSVRLKFDAAMSDFKDEMR